MYTYEISKTEKGWFFVIKESVGPFETRKEAQEYVKDHYVIAENLVATIAEICRDK